VTKSLIICTVQNVIRMDELTKVEMRDEFGKCGKNRISRAVLKKNLVGRCNLVD